MDAKKKEGKTPLFLKINRNLYQVYGKIDLHIGDDLLQYNIKADVLNIISYSDEKHLLIVKNK